MAQKITLSLKEGNVKFAKRKARLKNTSVSQIVDKQPDLLKRIDEMLEKEKLGPLGKKICGYGGYR